MISINEALSIIARSVDQIGTEEIALSDSVGRILAQSIIADLDLPPFDRSQMDGFAVRSVDFAKDPQVLEIIGESIAGRGFDGGLGPGQSVRIMTGARVPAGADAVQQVEKTAERQGTIEVFGPITSGMNIVRRASEISQGDVLFRTGTVITDKMIAALASFGYGEVAVSAIPKVAILATGSEIVDIGQVPGPDQIRNSNSAMLGAFCRSIGLPFAEYPRVADDREALAETVSAMARSDARMLVLTGGVSVGDYDFTKDALRDAGCEILFEKVSLKPGKPTVFGMIDGKPVFGLPGNPVSVAVTFHLFAVFAALLMQGAATPEMRRGRAVSMQNIRGARERDCLIPVSLSTDADGHLTVDSVRFGGSSNFVAFSFAEALVHIPKAQTVEKGQVADIYFLR